jgi:vacuolar-type H+-ATPase subunit E/Vma4
VVVWVEEYAKADENLIDLAQQQVTWGEYIARTKNLSAEVQTKSLAALQNIQANLEASHQQELAQRQAAATAMAQYYQNQQLINAVSRPVTTNCNRFGSMVNCTTY